ncbi:DUF1702 family protein [Allorhizocola rhizosphaerae]|uniref:DUF1702 family protein n=1 Tax=Allorhizocola rhizosphaerae TaxID=1872709 RepID=UPI000E3C1CD1|nr:DUF1702 family protein [Allorhizocola rhizosphaerae]
MPTVLGSMRRLLLAPELTEVGFRRRGFPLDPPQVVEQLEAVPQAVVCGFEWGIDARGLWEVQRRLELVDPQLRGYAYEGATMAYTVLDTMRPGASRHTAALLAGPGRKHLFLCYIGIGFAMARLPRPLWRSVLPELPGVPYHPTMSWLAVDGYGFDRAYFDTHRWVGQQRRPRPYPWLGHPGYFERAFDQGVGRALWFVHAARVPDVLAAVAKFAAGRRADLWSGIGLAVAFAGGADRQGLATLRREAGAYWPELAQGVLFAAKAREYAGYVPQHAELATSVLIDMSVAEAARLADEAVARQGDEVGVPRYEVWRRRMQGYFRDGSAYVKKTLPGNDCHASGE